MTISMEYYYSSRVVAGFFQKVASLLSFVVGRLLLPCYCWWSGNEEIREADEAGAEQQHRRHHQLAAAQAVRESLQVATYGEVAGTAAAVATCAVCLSEVRRKDRVWELRNCCHVFHKACLDRWLDHDEHLTCPLCRAPLLTAVYGPASFPPAAAEPSWAVERLLYLFGDDLLCAPLS